MVQRASENNEKIDAPILRHKGMTEEEYLHMRHTHSNDSKETDVWGRFTAMNAVDSHDAMWDAFPKVQQFRVPRTVAERLDLTANAKLVFGVLACFPCGLTLYRYEIAGLCGLSAYTVSVAIHDLEAKNLLKITPQWREKGTRRGPSFYQLVQPPNRFHNKDPRFLYNDISKFEEVIRERFYDLEPEC